MRSQTHGRLRLEDPLHHPHRRLFHPRLRPVVVEQPPRVDELRPHAPEAQPLVQPPRRVVDAHLQEHAPASPASRLLHHPAHHLRPDALVAPRLRHLQREQVQRPPRPFRSAMLTVPTSSPSRSAASSSRYPSPCSRQRFASCAAVVSGISAASASISCRRSGLRRVAGLTAVATPA